MRLLVTGGAGYIGSVVAARALQAGHNVTVLDNLTQGHRAAVPSGARLVQCDLLDEGSVTKALGSGVDAILHFAALSIVPDSMRRPEAYYRNNVVGTLNLLDAMREAGVRRLVFSSTAAVYGDPEQVPITEDAPTRPGNPYGASKLAIDRMIGDHALAHGLEAFSLRYFNVGGAVEGLGEHHRPETHLIPNLLAAAAGRQPAVKLFGTDYPTPDGSAIRDYVHIWDLAEAHLLALEVAAEPGSHRIYNLGSGAGFSVREVIAAACEVTGARIAVEEAPRRPGDPPRLVASSARIKAELGWSPRKGSLPQILADHWAWGQAHPDGYRD